MLAEPGLQYGAKVFEEYERVKGICETVPRTKFSKLKNEGV